MRWLEIVKNLLFPEVRCISCDEPRKLDPGSALCDDCAASLKSLLISKNACERCLSPQKAGEHCAYCAQGGMRELERAYAPYVYKGAVQKLIVRLKFGPCNLAAQPLANAMTETISGVRADAMVPVPLHRTGLRERGINQSLLLCQLIAPKVNAPILEALRKDRRTKRQSSLHHKDREANVKGAYSVCVPVDDLHILLVDDVRTSGATARACAKALKNAGATSVSLLTAAVAQSRSSVYEL